MPYFIGRKPVTLDEYVAHYVFDQVRTEGDVTTYEVVDRLNPAQLDSRIVGVFDTEPEMAALLDSLRRQYATNIELRGRP